MRIPFLTTCLAVAALTACGSTTSSSSGTAPGTGGNGGDVSAAAAAAQAHPCTVLTQAQAVDAFGAPLKAGSERFTVTPVCYFATAGTTHFADHVDVQIQPLRVFDGTKVSHNTVFRIVPVSGVGDDAFYQEFTSGSGLNLLAFKKDGIAVYIGVMKYGASVSDIEAIERSLAIMAAGNV